MYLLTDFFNNLFKIFVKIELTIDLNTKQFFAIPVWYSVFTYFNVSWPINIDDIFQGLPSFGYLKTIQIN